MGTWILLFGLWAQAGDPPDREVTLMMHERFAYATMLRTSLIHGFLDRGLRHARQLEEALDDLSSPALVEAVGATVRADSLGAAAAGAARIAESCGACHQDNDVRVLIQSGRSAPWEDTLQARMGRHIWAADRMWAGLVGHDMEAWMRGAQLLADDPFLSSRDALAVEGERLDALAGLADEAISAEDWSGRAAVYGRFLGKCADCHAASMDDTQ